MIGILGASGYIGQQFSQELVSQETVFREYNRTRDDYYDLKKLIDILHRDNITVLINCAGYTGKPNVDACEYNKDECYNSNVELAKNVAVACSLTDVKLVHISSGCIYTGDNQGKGFSEEDEPNFHSNSKIKGSFYSSTKTLAESVVKSSWTNSYIARLRIPFDEYDNPRNYLTKLQKYEKLLDAKNSISHRGDFVKACIYLFKNKADFGIYNIVNSEPVTTSEVAELLKQEGLLESYTLLNEEQFYKDIKPKAPRSNCVLNNNKLLNSGFNMRSSKDALIESIQKLKL
jgi:dTDP-4-dehydrorhamnose reductase